MKVFGLTTATATATGDGDVSLQQCDGTESQSDIEKEERTTDSDTARSGQVCDQNAGSLSFNWILMRENFVTAL